jgi:hypothetical protein
MPPFFFPAEPAGTVFGVRGGVQAVELRQAMASRRQSRRSGRGTRKGELQWLSRLIATMEHIAQPEVRALPCDRLVLTAVRAQLARPVRAFPAGATPFTLN